MERPALIVHGGAGRGSEPPEAERSAGCAAALDTAWALLSGGGSAVEAVVAAVSVLEDHPLFNAGVGASLTSAGTVELDASIMDGRRLRAGGVGAVSTVVNPVRLAQAIMDDDRHVLLVGAGAEAFAAARDIALAAPAHFITARQRRRWESAGAEDGGTVGAVAVDRYGNVAAATSTGGLMHKLPGRVGDSAVIGAGTYADNAGGAASATGHGEAILRAGLAKAAVDALRGGAHPSSVAMELVDQLTRRHGASAGLILVDRFGRIGWAKNTPQMMTGVRTATGTRAIFDGRT
jgi:beta-aspartyl-peptidase (threonine type)